MFEQFPAWMFWLFVFALPVGLGAASYWAKGGSRNQRPKVDPGAPGNPD